MLARPHGTAQAPNSGTVAPRLDLDQRFRRGGRLRSDLRTARATRQLFRLRLIDLRSGMRRFDLYQSLR
jgi:hypothetical protein